MKNPVYMNMSFCYSQSIFFFFLFFRSSIRTFTAPVWMYAFDRVHSQWRWQRNWSRKWVWRERWWIGREWPPLSIIQSLSDDGSLGAVRGSFIKRAISSPSAARETREASDTGPYTRTARILFESFLSAIFPSCPLLSESKPEMA
jgi:hypothetical protein